MGQCGKGQCDKGQGCKGQGCRANIRKLAVVEVGRARADVPQLNCHRPESIATEIHCVDDSNNFIKNGLAHVATLDLTNRLIYSLLASEGISLRFPLRLSLNYITTCMYT